MTYDLHSHTTASDGSLSPEELLNAATEAGVRTLAITDHDCVTGVKSVQQHKHDLTLIPGIEFSTSWSGVGIHVLGLNIATDAESIEAGAAQQTRARIERAATITKRLQSKGLVLDYDELIEQAGTDAPGRPHIAKYLLSKNLVKTEQDAFKKYLGAGKPGDVKNLWAELQTVINWISDSGGTPVLAHPGKYKLTNAKLTRLCKEFQELGGQGIEVVSGKQSDDLTRRLARITNELGMLSSCGSDFHQPGQSWGRLGEAPALPDSCTPVWDVW